MVEDILGFIQVGFKGFLTCLGLEKNAPPSQPATADEAATTDPPVDVLSSPNDTTAITTDLDNNDSAENTSTLVTIDELINSIGNTTVDQAQYVELVDDGKTNTSLLATSLISSGGPGGSH